MIGKTNGKEWQLFVQWVTKSEKEWQQVITNGKQRQRVVQRMTTSSTMSDNEQQKMILVKLNLEELCVPQKLHIS